MSESLPPSSVPAAPVPAAPGSPSSPPSGGSRWLLAVLVVVFGALIGIGGLSFQSKLGDVEKNDNASFLPGSAESTKVANEVDKFNDVSFIPGFVVYQRDGGLTDADRARITADIATLQRIDGVAADQVGPPTFSKSGTTASLAVPLVARVGGADVDGEKLADTETAIRTAVQTDVPDGLEVHTAGAAAILGALIEVFNGIDGVLLLAALFVVVLILLIVYRSPILWFIPLLSAMFALGLSTMLVYYLTKSGAITLNGQSAGILSVLVLGAGTDYALLMVSRYREELHSFESRWDAMRSAWRGAAPAIIASASTVVAGLLCLLFSELNSNRGLGPVLAIGVACTALVMLTFLPALLMMFPRWLFWPRVPKVDHASDIANHGVWSKIATWVGRRGRVHWIVTTLILIGFGFGLTQLNDKGIRQDQSFTKSPDAVTGQRIYDAEFDQGAGTPIIITLVADKVDAVSSAVQDVKGVAQGAGSVCLAPDYAKLAAAIKAAGPGAIPSGGGQGCLPASLSVTPRDGRTVLNVAMSDAYDSQAGYDTVKAVRDAVRAVPGADAKVGGQSAIQLDVLDASARDRNVIIPIVLVVILAILALLLRAIVAPVLLILTVVLSFGATLGISALFFNHVFHFPGADPSFPLFAFVFLVALGIDYNIFLMTRIREESVQFGTRDGVLRGLAVTGGVITSAGVVLAATFAVLGVLPLVMFAEIGFAVALGVLLDTLIVRSVLVPALAHDIGRWIWWPSQLSKAPQPEQIQPAEPVGARS